MSDARLREGDLIHVRCDSCDADDARLAMTKPGVVYACELAVVCCRRCGHAYVNPRLSDEKIEALYDDEYYAGRGFDRTIDYTRNETDEEVLSRYADELETLREALGELKGASILDVGCGTGSFVRALRLSGADAVGFDTSSFANAACDRLGVPLAARTLDELYAAGRAYDAVVAIEVIEHTLSPKRFLCGIASLVRPGGTVFIETGNWNFVRRLPGTPYIMPEGHIHYLTPASLRRYFAAAGLDVIDSVNYTWTGWRRFARYFGARAGVLILHVAHRCARLLVPSLAALPLGRKPERS